MKRLLLALCALLPFSAAALDPARLNSTFILAPASTLQASAGTAGVVSCTVSVAQLQGAVDTPTAVTPTFLASSVTPLYTSTPGVTSLISSIACANTSASQVTNLKIFAAGSGTVNEVLVLDTFPAHGSLTYTDTGWRVLDGTGALITSGGGGGTVIGGTGINITGGTTVNISNQIAAGGPTGSATVAPILTYNAQGQLTAVGSAVITPPFSALTGSAACSQLPALTGDTTTSAGTCATSTTKTGGVAFGTLATLNAAPAGTLTGATLAAGVTGSSLTSVGTLGGLTVTAPIAGSVTGSAASLSTVLDCTKFPALSGAITTPAGSCVTTASAIPTTSLTGALQAAQEPAHTGDMTNTAGSLATTVSKFNGGTPLASAAGKTTGISVDDPGTGALEYLIKPQTIVTGASKAWAASDYYKSQKRSNSGSAMSDTLPCGTANGQSMLLNNVDVSATDTLTVSGCTFTSATGIAGGTTFGLNFARRSRFVWNAGTSSWDIEVNSNNVVKTISPVTVGNLPIFSTYTSGIELSPFTGTGYVKATGGGPITAAATVPSADLAITPTTCTNQFVTAISAGGLGTCTTDTLASAQHANQGTTTQVLHGNAAGNPSFSAVSDGDFSGQLSVAHGGTGQAALSSVSLSAFGAPTGTLSMGTQFVSNVKDAVNPLDAVNLETLQAATNSVDSRDSAVYATAAALPANTYNNGSSGVGATLTATANGPLTVDTQLAVSGQRILVKNESAPANNGIYTVTQPGVVAVSPYILTRTLDFNASAEIFTGILIPVQSGTVSPGAANNNQIFVSAAASPFTVGTTAVNFSAIASTYTAGTGLTLTGTQFSITPTITGGGPTGSASVVPVITYNAQGQLTAVSTAAITPTAIGAVPTTRNVNTTAPITGGGALSADLTLALTTSPAGQTPVGVTRTITATAPLTIAGTTSADLSADRTIAITAATATAAGSQSAVQFVKTAGSSIDPVADYGAFADEVAFSDCAIGAGSATLTCATSTPFLSTDCQGGTGCTGTTGNKKVVVPTCAAASAQLATTIIGFTSSSAVTLNNTCTSAITANTTEIYWGHDDTTALTNAINAQQAGNYPSACVYLSKGVTGAYWFQSALPTITKHFCMRGNGASANSDVGNYRQAGGSWIAWHGASNVSAALAFAPVTGASNPAIVGSELRDFSIDCRNGDQWQCLDGISMQSVHGWHFENIAIFDPLVGIDGYVVSTLGEARDLTRGEFINVKQRVADANKLPLYASTTTGTGTFGTGSQSIAVTAVTNIVVPGLFWIESNIGQPTLVNCTGTTAGASPLTGCTSRAQDVINGQTWVAGSNIVQASPSNGPAWLMAGDTTANSCCFTIVGGSILHGITWGPAAMEFANSDSIEVVNMVINGGNFTNDGAINRIRKPGVRFNGSNTSATLAARNNYFHGGSPGGNPASGVDSMGLLNTGAMMLAPASPNYWDRQQFGNGEQPPFVEAVTATTTQAPVGGIFEWSGNGSLSTFGVNSNSPTNPSNSLASTAATEVIIPGTLIKLPPQWAQVGTSIKWTVMMSKTAAGTPTHIFKVHYGTTGAVGTDAAFVTTAASAASTAAADVGVLEVAVTFPTVGAAVTPTVGVWRTHNIAAATGYGLLSTTAPTQAAINTGTAQEFMYLGMTTSATGETNTIVSVKKDIVQAAN